MTMGDRIHPTRERGTGPEEAGARLPVGHGTAAAPAPISGGTALHDEVAGSDEGSDDPNEPGG